MGFMDFLGRMAGGKPIFDEGAAAKNNDTPQQPVDSQPETGLEKSDPHTFPDVHIKRVSTRINGENMQVYCQILNTWNQEVMLDKITILGTKHEIDDFLNANEEQQFLVYDGPMPTDQNREAFLDYKIRDTGDYFQSVHDVTFMYHDDTRRYSVNEIRLRLPIRDIYE
jgi:hypothetical protein